ncbi:MAG: tRNA (adenosine(37)-N6)-threonylcarbamoyltransferase complex dimerization subunit type 1 TsaB [Hyphomicrobium sp.]|jgi:tRNA threonylcarbamoyladenosine biosynthesis protein TsaB
MKMLAFDTCFGACSAAVTWPSGEASRFELMDRGHAERLIPMIGEVMGEAPFAIDELDLIAVTIGPGTFTGLRIGIAAARALALASGAATSGISSLELMARSAKVALDAQDAGCDISGADIAVAVDARRDELYFEVFNGRFGSLAGPHLVSVRDAAAHLRDRATIMVGSGASLVVAAAQELGRDKVTAVLPRLEPDARHFAAPIKACETNQLRPIYLRPPDAKPQVGKSLSRIL